jgi:hypothetical protein
MVRTSRTVIVGIILTSTISLGLAGCSHTSTGFGRLTVDGQTKVASNGRDFRAAGTGDILRAGDRVQVTAGRAAIRLLAGGDLQLRAGTTITVNKTPRLTAGAVLVQAAGHPLQISALDATLVVPTGDAQLAVGSLTTGLTVKVYVATSHLDIVGNPPALIAAPRQINLTPQTRLPAQASPLQYVDADPWDHLYLSEAATIATQLAAAAIGFNAQLPATEPPAFYLQLLPSLGSQPGFMAAFAQVEGQQPTGPTAAMPGDDLIAAVIALRGTHGTFASRLSDELTFFDQGASWGFVAYDQGVEDLNGVVNDVLAGIGRTTLPIGTAPTPQSASSPPTTVNSTPTTRPTTQRTPPTTAPLGTPGHPRSQPVVTTTTTLLPLLHLPVPLLPGPLGSILNPLLDPLIQALDNILAGKA